MTTSLSHFGRIYLQDRELAKRDWTHPFLVWEAPPGDKMDDHLLATHAGSGAPRPRAGEPLIFELKKNSKKLNAFALGITVGRTDNNDVVLDDTSVSRFHAYLQQDLVTKEWRVVDAESKNGTWVDQQRLKPNVASAVSDKKSVKFGDIVVLFLKPSSFIEYLERVMKGG